MYVKILKSSRCSNHWYQNIWICGLLSYYSVYIKIKWVWGEKNWRLNSRFLTIDLGIYCQLLFTDSLIIWRKRLLSDFWLNEEAWRKQRSNNKVKVLLFNIWHILKMVWDPWIFWYLKFWLQRPFAWHQLDANMFFCIYIKKMLIPKFYHNF